MRFKLFANSIFIAFFIAISTGPAQGGSAPEVEPPPAGYGDAGDAPSPLISSLDSPLPSRDAADRQAQFRRFVERAVASYRQGDYATTAKSYVDAYRVQPEPLLLFNAAQALRKSESWADALALYQRFIAAAPKSPMVPEAEANSASVRASLDVQRIQSQLGVAEQEASRRRSEAERLARENAEKTQQNQELLLRVKEGRPLHKRPWFWVVLGGSVVAVAGLAVGLGVALSPKVADGTLGNLSVGFAGN
jgi:tetratricopeptide (TPR) repeat protein